MQMHTRTLLTPHHSDLIKAAGAQLREARATGTRPQVIALRKELDAVLEKVRIESPGAFHSNESLVERIFMHQPCREGVPTYDIPMGGFRIRASKPSQV